MRFKGPEEADKLSIKPLEWRTDRFVDRPTDALCSIVPPTCSAGRIGAVLRGIAPPQGLSEAPFKLKFSARPLASARDRNVVGQSGHGDGECR